MFFSTLSPFLSRVPGEVTRSIHRGARGVVALLLSERIGVLNVSRKPLLRSAASQSCVGQGVAVDYSPSPLLVLENKREWTLASCLTFGTPSRLHPPPTCLTATGALGDLAALSPKDWTQIWPDEV